MAASYSGMFKTALCKYIISIPEFPGGTVVKNRPADARDAGPVPGSGRSPGGGHGSPLQYSCQENFNGQRSPWATVHRAAKIQMQLSNWAHIHTYIKVLLQMLKKPGAFGNLNRPSSVGCNPLLPLPVQPVYDPRWFCKSCWVIGYS